MPKLSFRSALLSYFGYRMFLKLSKTQGTYQAGIKPEILPIFIKHKPDPKSPA